MTTTLIVTDEDEGRYARLTLDAGDAGTLSFGTWVEPGETDVEAHARLRENVAA